jgi:18S rRNA (guanine1575-N7)-methyltransferase
MAQRALELMGLPREAGGLHILDIGCGGGIAGELLEKRGHTWTGTDISFPMLQVAREREAEDDSDESDEDSDEDAEEPVAWVPPMVEVSRHDMGTHLPFRPGSFDGAISISAVQWLCNAEKKGDVPQRRLKTFFSSLFGVLRRGAKAVLQIYPENNDQLDMISTAATRCGFGGGVVVDFPHSTKAKKYYLVLATGQAIAYRQPEALTTGEDAFESGEEGDSDAEEGEEWEEDEDGEDEAVGQKRVRQDGKDKSRVKRRRLDKKGKGARPGVGSKSWVLMKKAKRRQFGLATRPDSKYTHRKRRSHRF